jgi:hypothetical protein
MATAVRAGVAYFAIIFAIGFALGMLRVLFVVPRFGETNAVLLELPVMLSLSWISCVWLVRHFTVPPGVAQRLTMGGVAFAMLMLGEVGVSIVGFGRTLVGHLAAYQETAAQLGLAAQIAFALFPLVLVLLRRRADA